MISSKNDGVVHKRKYYEKIINRVNELVGLQLGRIHNDRFLCLNGTIALSVGHIVRDTQQPHRIDESVATVRNAIRTACLMVELSVRTDRIAVVVGAYVTIQYG